MQLLPPVGLRRFDSLKGNRTRGPAAGSKQTLTRLPRRPDHPSEFPVLTAQLTNKQNYVLQPPKNSFSSRIRSARHPS